YYEFKQFVYNELNNLLNNELDSINAIGDLTLSNNNGIFSLKISSVNGYDFISKSSYLNAGNIVLSNLEFYRFINFAPINFTNFFDALQNYILDNKYTIQEFANWFNADSFKQFISQNLSNSSGELVNSELIGDVSFDPINNLIEITPATMYQFQETTSTKNLSINAKGNIIINNLEYYTLINLTKLDTLFNVVQNKISSNQWTNEEFADFVKNNNDQIKQLISKNLFINSTDLIDLSQIDNVTISDDFKLVITLTPSNKGKYTADENKNVSLNTNTLTISNLTYFAITNFTNLSTLQSAIQEKIDTNSWTSNQFLEYVEDNQKDIIDFVSTKLSITNNGTLPSSQISRIDFINETLRISLSPPDNVKYSMDKTDNFKLSNNVLIISNFTYFTDVRLTKLNVLHNAIQSEISSNKATEEEFAKFITDQQEDAKKLIANNLFVSEMSTISQSSIDSVAYNDGNVDITLLVPNNIKYSLNPYTNATLNNNVLTISNFTYFANVELDASTLKTAIENLISTEKATASEFESYIKTNQDSLKSLVVEKVGGLDNTSQISSIKYNNSDIEISLIATTNTKYVLENSFDDIKLSNDILTISNLDYFNDISLLNINNLYLAIQELIDSKQFTESDFGDYLNENKSQIINTIASKLYIANNTPISPSEISDVSLISKLLVITINSKNFTKYNLANDTNWMFNENTNELTLMNLSYFNLLNLGDLTSAYNVVQNKITSSKSTAYEFSSYLLNAANKSSLITDLETELNKNLNNVSISIKDVAYNNSNID
ncbi:MAG: hypothetical protein K2I49_00845, partial [Ureaplasma sp.]|nr:hypothetical protein [Ureaplasma sp.]